MSAAPAEAVKEGWGAIRPGDRRAHYYRDTMSLCRRVAFYRGPLDAEDYKTKDDCAACRKVLDREAAKVGLRVTDTSEETGPMSESRRFWGVRDWLLWAVLCAVAFVIIGGVFAAMSQLSGQGFSGVPLFAACYWPAAVVSALGVQAWRWWRTRKDLQS